jgi:hypothetical protein
MTVRDLSVGLILPCLGHQRERVPGYRLGGLRRFRALRATNDPTNTKATANAARIKYMRGKAGAVGATPVEAVVVLWVLVVAELPLVVEEDADVLLVEVDDVVEEVLVDALDEVVLVAWTNTAVSVSGPFTTAVVTSDVEFSMTELPVAETHPEKRKPSFAAADIPTDEEALNQFEVDGVVVPAPSGDTWKPNEYCRA